ncbi:MAG: hypothetical protein JW776_02735 [Candidatus Lokiarchaeota archaeon]|nr:hypothetical protein [Candidatus Lokiarchaeota archaeon]
MKKASSRHKVLDFSISDDLIIYPAFYSSSPTCDSKQNIGILISDLRGKTGMIELLNQLYRYSLIDSFSIQFEVTDMIRPYLFLKIHGIGSNELKFRYINLKKRLETVGNLHFLKNLHLQSKYLSVLGINEQKQIHTMSILREKQSYYICSPECGKKYFFLSEIDFSWLSENYIRIRTITELLHAKNLQSSLVLYSKNLGNSSESSYYVFATPNHLFTFSQNLTVILSQCGYSLKIRNCFHPYYLGRVLTRGSLHKKYLQQTKSPPVLNMDLGLVLPNNFSFQDTHSSNMETKHMDPGDTIEDILSHVPYEKKSEGFYLLFGGDIIFFTIKTLNTSTVQFITNQLTQSFHICILFFHNKVDYEKFLKKVKKSDLQKCEVINSPSDLKELIKGLSLKYSLQKGEGS